jgi:hypothetical protein
MLENTESISAGLSVMLKEARMVLESTVASDSLVDAAETTIQSLLKSSAIHGFNLVSEDR